MANHKRRRPKNRRAGCGLCKPHKRNGAKKKEKASVKRKLTDGERHDYDIWLSVFGGP